MEDRDNHFSVGTSRSVELLALRPDPLLIIANGVRAFLEGQPNLSQIHADNFIYMLSSP